MWSDQSSLGKSDPSGPSPLGEAPFQRDHLPPEQDRSLSLHFYFALGDFHCTVRYIAVHILFTIIGAVILAIQLGVLEVHWPPPALEDL
ncbi:hypothetical protein BST61_g3352 [Cercospora zeina]